MSVAGVSLCMARTPFVDGSRAGSPPCSLGSPMRSDVGAEDLLPLTKNYETRVAAFFVLVSILRREKDCFHMKT